MNNVRKGKIDSNNISVLKRAALNLKALLVSPKTLEGIDKANLEDPIEILYGNQQLVNPGYLSEERPIKEPTYVTPEARLVNADSSNPLNRAASRIVGFDVTRDETPVPQSPKNENSTISPIAQKVPEVSIEEPNSSIQLEQPVPEEVQVPQENPQITPVYIQPSNNQNKIVEPDSVEAAINYEVVRNPQEPRREVIEPPLQTPQEFEMPERKNNNLFADLDIKNEERRNRLNQEYEVVKQKLKESFNKMLDAIDEYNKLLNSLHDEASREIAAARADERNGLARVEDAVNNQQDMLNEYSGGIYNAR